jgi:hypothetical protein
MKPACRQASQAELRSARSKKVSAELFAHGWRRWRKDLIMRSVISFLLPNDFEVRRVQAKQSMGFVK